MKKTYFASFDLLRFLTAVSIAFVYHYAILFGARPYSDKTVMQYLYAYAYYGVELFFAVSGFVLYFSYYEKLRERRLGVFEFIIKRIKRIYPVMILTVVAAAAGQWISVYRFGHVAALEVGDGRNSLPAFLFSLAGVQCGWFADHDSMSINGPAWFVSILMICYLLFGLILQGCGENKRKENMCFGLLVLLGIQLYERPYDFPLLYQSCGRGYLNFFGGALLAQLVQRTDTRKSRHLSVCCGAAGLALFAVLFRIGLLGNMDLAVSCVAVPCILLIFAEIRIWNQILDRKLIAYLGKISFSVYLWNIPIAIWVYLGVELSNRGCNFADPGFFWLFIIISMAIAVATYEFYEKPLMKWLDTGWRKTKK